MARRGGLLMMIGAVAVICTVGVLAAILAFDGTDGERAAPTPTVAILETIEARQLREPALATPQPGDQTRAVAYDSFPPSAEAVIERVSPAVVTVINRQRTEPLLPGDLQPAGVGTGFIIDEAGHVVTHRQVVAGGDLFDVVFHDGTRRSAELVGSDEMTELAVIKFDGPVPAVASLGDSSRLKPGQPVLAIGSPFGAFTNTVTQGIVSALGRSLVEQPGKPELTGLIQHDAAINPGNFGGPLLNFDGEVVGVNALAIPERGGRPIQGLFFAIPSNTVQRVARALIERGYVDYPYLGVQLLPVTEQLASQYQLPVTYGVYIVEVVPGGPADRAGLRAGDIILSLDGARIDERRSFTEVLFAHEPGDTVRVEIQRGGSAFEVSMTLGRRPR